MEQKVLLESIQACRRRLNMAEFNRCLVFALGIGASVGILFQTAAFVVPFYYVNLCTVLAIVFAVIAAAVAAYIKRKNVKQAALFMDSFGFRERIVTAYENFGADGEMLRLQREDAMRQLQAHKERIRIPLMPSKKRLAWVTGMFVLMIGMAFIPSTVKEEAKELHQVRKEAGEKEEELEEVLEELEELAQEELTPEQLETLQEMMESLESSMAEYQQVNSTEMLNEATEKLEYKYEDMNSQLASLAQSLQNGATASVATAESMQAMAEKLQEMSGMPSEGNQSLASNQGQNGQNGNGQNGNQSGGSGSGQGDGSGDGQNGDQGSGNGQGNGSGNGQGNGSGNGQGNGSGNGRGEGSSSGTHDYVSIPNEIIDSGNLTGNAQNHDTSEYFRAQNGLNWEGTHVSHEAVIGSYEQNAYEGIAAGKYPSGMEDVIKEYFSSFN